MQVRRLTVMPLAWLALATASPLAAQDTDDALLPSVGSDALLAAADPQPGVDTGIDRLELDRTEIVGNQELPQVLYIVPWKSSDMGDLIGRPVNTLLDEVLAPTDREVFVRQIRYYDDLNQTGGATPARTARRAVPAAADETEEQSQ